MVASADIACCGGCAQPPAAERREPTIDPEGVELRALREAARFENARVLEIGSGDGRLSLRYAHEAARVVGVDLDGSLVAEANGRRPRELRDRLHFERADALHLPFRGGTFDIALLGWSL